METLPTPAERAAAARSAMIGANYLDARRRREGFAPARLDDEDWQ